MTFEFPPEHGGCIVWSRFLRDLAGVEEKEESRKQAPSVGNTVVPLYGLQVLDVHFCTHLGLMAVRVSILSCLSVSSGAIAVILAFEHCCIKGRLCTGDT